MDELVLLEDTTRLDELAAELMPFNEECPLRHVFTDNLYSRTIYMKAGLMVVSKRHKTQHQFCILQGTVDVKIKEDEWERLVAPHMGITEAGTQRLLYIVEDCIWATFHSTDKVTPEAVEEDIIQKSISKALKKQEV